VKTTISPTETTTDFKIQQRTGGCDFLCENERNIILYIVDRIMRNFLKL
jgi:hypothetical protein